MSHLTFLLQRYISLFQTIKPLNSQTPKYPPLDIIFSKPSCNRRCNKQDHKPKHQHSITSEYFDHTTKPSLRRVGRTYASIETRTHVSNCMNSLFHYLYQDIGTVPVMGTPMTKVTIPTSKNMKGAMKMKGSKKKIIVIGVYRSSIWDILREMYADGVLSFW